MRLTLALLSLLILGFGCTQSQTKQSDNESHEFTNKLINESSPYLLQHAHNPVNWYPWGDEALEKAKKENKLIIISIGYAACHWCHVMEHESFEDSTVAKLMNDRFISIKVDREERPDVDQVYMNAVQLLTGRGGWPLNAFALPDGRPFFAGTYFPKENWISLLEKINEFYQNEPEKAEKQAAELTNGVKSSGIVALNEAVPDFNQGLLDDTYTNMESQIDFTLGGQNHEPKFPLPIGYQFLLNYHHQTGNDRALEAVTVTLDQMAMGGIYDQVGGGFARYSTDKFWKAPHFEKMLYDNGQLVSLYSKAYQLTKKPRYKEVVYETLEFIERELTSQEGGFYSSLDADSEGEEGKFYVWTKQEFDEVLAEESKLISDYYSVAKTGNWEHGQNILLMKKSLNDFARKNNMTPAECSKKIKAARAKLLKARAKRIRPGLDDKILTAWNAIMLKGYVDAYRVFNEQSFLDKALINAHFITDNNLDKDGRLNRNYKNGQSSINAFLDDYALTIEAFIALYQATFDEQWLKKAKLLLTYTQEHFLDNSSKMFYYNSDLDKGLIARKMELTDNVIPASNSVMASNLYMLGEYFYEPSFIDHSRQMLNNVKDQLKEGGFYYSNWALLYSYFTKPPYEVAIVGDDFKKKRIEFDQQYIPNSILLGGKNEGKLPLLENKLVDGQTTIYVCQNKSCRRPVTEVSEALKLIK